MELKDVGNYIGFFVGFISIFLVAGKFALHQLIQKTKDNQKLQSQGIKDQFNLLHDSLRELRLDINHAREDIARLEKLLFTTNSKTQSIEEHLQRVDAVLDKITEVSLRRNGEDSQKLEVKPLGEGAYRVTTKKKP